MNILSKFLFNIPSSFFLIKLLFTHALITTCYCANGTEYFYKVTPKVEVTQNQIQIHFKCIAVNEDSTPISTTEFTFSLSKIGVGAGFLGLTFRQQMLQLLNAFRGIDGKIPPGLNNILFFTTLMVCGSIYITGKGLVMYFEKLREFNQENLNITELDKNQDKPFFYITFTKHDEIQVLEGIKVFKYLAENWREKPVHQHDQRLASEAEVVESPTLHTNHIESVFETTDTDSLALDVVKVLKSYVAPLKTLARKLSNAENQALQLENDLPEYDSPLFSASQRHMTKFSFSKHSVIEASSYFYELHWVIIGSIIICLSVILLNLYVFLSFSKPDLILKKEIINKYKDRLEKSELIQELNTVRKFLLKLSMIWNFISVILLGCFWYIFEKVISVLV